jgi:hypothetical protein
MRPEERYQKYVKYCESVGVSPMTFDCWLANWAGTRQLFMPNKR